MNTNAMLCRQATPQEKEFYFEKLYPLQDIVLGLMDTPAFYLTGGTALSRFHYHHRFSDDLDFFYNGYSYPKENFHFTYREVIHKLENVFDNIEVTIDGEFFKRLFIHHTNVSLKIEFIYENYKTVGEKELFKKMAVDSKENICANKIGAVMDRRTAKDFIDLFYLLKDVDLQQALRWAELKKVPSDYEGLMIGIGDLRRNPALLEGNVLTIQPIDENEFTGFIKSLVGNLLKDAKTT